MAVSKIVYDGRILIDLTGDTVEESKLLKGYTAHSKSGEEITGACTFDVDTSKVSATPSEILSGKTAGVKGNIVTGTMKNNGGVTGNISTVAGAYTIPQGYHDGSGKVSISTTEQAKLIAENIRSGVTVLGVVGTMSGTEDAKAQSVMVTPKSTEQEILPDALSGYNYLASVTVKPIPYVESLNEAGGTTVTIG